MGRNKWIVLVLFVFCHAALSGAAFIWHYKLGAASFDGKVVANSHLQMAEVLQTVFFFPLAKPMLESVPMYGALGWSAVLLNSVLVVLAAMFVLRLWANAQMRLVSFVAVVLAGFSYLAAPGAMPSKASFTRVEGVWRADAGRTDPRCLHGAVTTPSGTQVNVSTQKSFASFIQPLEGRRVTAYVKPLNGQNFAHEILTDDGIGLTFEQYRNSQDTPRVVSWLLSAALGLASAVLFGLILLRRPNGIEPMRSKDVRP